MPKSAISKKKPAHLSYIVTASGPDQWITPDDIVEARPCRDSQYVHKTGDRVTINGFKTAVNEERGDRNMTQQLLAYLAKTTVKPMDANAAYCCALAHTSNLTPTATVDRTCVFFPPETPPLKFDTVALLKQIMAEEAKDNGFNGIFAPFAAKHVKKVLRVVPNTLLFTPNGIMKDYHLEMCILTGMGILVARGYLYIPRDQMEALEKTHVGTVKFTQTHINWHSWGFDAERRWASPWKSSCVGHPFP